jgi:hypothetical protein
MAKYRRFNLSRRNRRGEMRRNCLGDVIERSDNVELIARPIQEVTLEYFTQLRANDIVSIDSNHVVRWQQSQLHCSRNSSDHPKRSAGAFS